MSCIVRLGTSLLLLLAVAAPAADAPKANEPYAPHTPTLIFYLIGANGPEDKAAIQRSIEKLKSASVIEVNANRAYARIRFDSHVVSYHQVAQSLADAGNSIGKNYDPCLIFAVTDYAKSGNASRVDRIFSGKRLNSRVHVKPLDQEKGVFAVHFLPLEIDPKSTAPQGFNGGHLHHPISDPVPRGLGLNSLYATEYDPSIFEKLNITAVNSAATKPTK